MRRLRLIHAPTPLVKRPALDELFGLDLWIKRDDATGGAEAGNKVRKLEFLLGDALERRSTHVVTCGGIQSNHARATAIVCAQLGLGCTLLLRVPEGEVPGPDVDAPKERLPLAGNVLLNRMVGAHIRLITPKDYESRAACMEKVAADLREQGETPYVVPEGGSNGLGSLGYVEAMREVRQQLDRGLGGGKRRFDVVVHACGSGGTAAGVALGSRAHDVAGRVRAFAVCDDGKYFERVIGRIVKEARAHDASLPEPAPLVVDDASKGPRYGVMTSEQRSLVVSVARLSGSILDPVYTGKAMHGLREAVLRGDVARGSRVLFVHTGGLPGLLADGADLSGEL